MIQQIQKINGILNNEENKTTLLGLIVILSVLWIVLYFIPELIILLLNTLLGNLILLLSILFIYMHNRMYGYIIGLCILIMYRFSRLNKEGFTDDSQNDFLNIQNKINRQTHFNMNMIENQASQDDLNYFNQHSKWYWSPSTINQYEEAVNNNPFIRTIASQATADAQTIYNENAILKILSNQSPEGHFLLHGIEINENEKHDGYGNFGENSGLIPKSIIQCNEQHQLKKINMQQHQINSVNYNDLETLISGFTFLNKPCNPCSKSCNYQISKL